jgi:hypothetical protein
MAGTSAAFANDLLELFFMAVAIANLATNATASPATTISWALHTADPVAGTQATSETTYTSYARQFNNRDATGWTTTANVINNDANVDFPECTGGTATITFFSLGSGVSNYMMFCGAVSPSISVVSGVIPRLTTATSVTIT